MGNNQRQYTREAGGLGGGEPGHHEESVVQGPDAFHSVRSLCARQTHKQAGMKSLGVVDGCAAGTRPGMHVNLY